ncbi:MAG: sulfotransferase [Pseudomonadota bacterium]
MSKSKVSDHWKEKAILGYALRLFGSTFRVLANLALFLAPFGCLFLVAYLLKRPDVTEPLFGLAGIAAITAIAVVYVSVRGRVVKPSKREDDSESSYSATDQMLHRLALENQFVMRRGLALEARRLSDEHLSAAQNGAHVFVAGLARAGTTALTRGLFSTGAFASLTYRDMPFVLAPNIWAKWGRRDKASIALRERAHGDGILVDLDSPESLEEPFWQFKLGSDYIKGDRLVPHAVSDDIGAAYQAYVGSILKRYSKTRYLAKNNNAVLRTDALLGQFSNAHVLVPFRHPVDHAQSLLKQHKRFRAHTDPFTTDYMKMLAHYEFGARMKPFVIDGDVPQGDPDTLEYWLHQWLIVYSYLGQKVEQDKTGRMHLLCYEDVCDPSAETWTRLLTELDLGAPEFPFKNKNNPSKTAAEPLRHADDAFALYDRMRNRSCGHDAQVTKEIPA